MITSFGLLALAMFIGSLLANAVWAFWLEPFLRRRGWL